MSLSPVAGAQFTTLASDDNPCKIFVNYPTSVLILQLPSLGCGQQIKCLPKSSTVFNT
jgi:hypothetical protein